MRPANIQEINNRGEWAKNGEKIPNSNEQKFCANPGNKIVKSHSKYLSVYTMLVKEWIQCVFHVSLLVHLKMEINTREKKTQS